MITEKIVTAVCKNAPQENKNIIINELVKHLQRQYNAEGNVNHILSVLVDAKDIVTVNRIDVIYIKQHPNLLIWNSKDYDIKNIAIHSVDNIDCDVKVTYKFKALAEEETDNKDYADSYTNISFIDHPEILK